MLWYFILMSKTTVEDKCVDMPTVWITGVSVIKRLSLYDFALWDRDLVSVVRIREVPYYRSFLKENV